MSRFSRRNDLYAKGSALYGSKWTAERFISEPLEPTEPTAAVRASGAHLTWTSVNEPDLKHFRVYRSLSKADFEVLAGGVEQTDFLDDGAVTATAYDHRIAAIRSDGVRSPMSEIFSVTP